MKITTVSISYSRKFNLGNYESIDLGCSLWAQVDEEEEADRVAEFLYLQAKTSVKNAVIPVLKASEHQMNNVHSQRKYNDKIVEDNWENF
jgi:hypothetical protein